MFPIVIVKNLPFSVLSDTLYEVCGKFGDIHQLRVPDSSFDKDPQYQPGSALVVYTTVEAAQRAAKELNGVNLQGRYVVASLFQVDKAKLSEEDIIPRKEELDRLKQQYQIE